MADKQGEKETWDLEAWLRGIGSLYEGYAQVFRNQGYEERIAVEELNDEDLDRLGIELLGHRKSLKKESKKLCQSSPVSAVTTIALGKQGAPFDEIGFEGVMEQKETPAHWRKFLGLLEISFEDVRNTTDSSIDDLLKQWVEKEKTISAIERAQITSYWKNLRDPPPSAPAHGYPRLET